MNATLPSTRLVIAALSFLSALRLSRCRSVVIFLVRQRHPCDCQTGRPALVSARGTVPVASPGQDAVELVAEAGGELGEDLAQVVLDCARGEVQPGADLPGSGCRGSAARSGAPAR